MKRLQYVTNLTRFAFQANPLLWLSIVISLFSAAVELLAMSSLMPLFELVSGNQPTQHGLIARLLQMVGASVTAQSLLWAFIALFAIRIATQLAGTSLSTLLGKRVMAQLCSGAFDQIVHRLSIREVSERSIGFYISLAGDESFRASTLILSLTQLVSIGALALFYFLAIATYSRGAAGFVLAFLACAGVVLIRVVKLSHRLGMRQTDESRKAGSVFLDALNNIKTVRAFSAERYVVNIHKALMFGYARVLFLVDEVALMMRLIPVLLLFLFFSIWLALSGARLESVGVAFIVTMIVYLMRFFPVVGQAVTLLMKVASDARSGKDVTAILDLPVAARSGTAKLRGQIEKIELRDVCFSYDGPDGKMVLQNVNMTFGRGRSYALAGKSGLGKSTLLDILLKFHEPTSGGLYLNGQSLAEVADAEIRKRIILVGQEPAIFDDTVRNNICLGLPADPAQVEAACRMACIHEVIEALPAGYDTRLQYRGTNLSGGQRQRIAIARALLRKPEVLILDEGTSALDKSTQHQVAENILAIQPESICIFVTHDPLLMERVSEVIDLERVNMRVATPDAVAG